MSGLRFRRVAIRRMLAIAEPFELRDLAGGVNLVFGPNASGKTTTARALEALLWPRAADRETTSLEALAETGNDRWYVRIDAGLIEYQQNGVPAASLPTAPLENRDRYRLWLPDLLRADDSDFAKKILIESSGGFDLEEAARVLERRKPSHRRRQQQQDLRRARERVREARAVQEALVVERRTLAAKEERLGRAPELERNLRLLRLGLDHASRRDDAAAARRRLESFPSLLARIQGDEAERIDELKRRIDEAGTRLVAAEALRTRAERDLRRLAVPPPLAESDILHRVSADLDRLLELERTISECERASKVAADRLADEAAPLRLLAEPNRLAAMDLEGLGDLARTIETAERIRETRRALAAELAALPEGEGPDVDLHRLRQGAFLLKQWLAVAEEDTLESRYLRRVAIGANLALFLVSLVLLLTGGFVAGAVVLVTSGAVHAALQRAPNRVDARPDVEREYLRLGLLEAPDLWESSAVAACRDRLDERIERAAAVERTRARRSQLVARLREAEQEEIPASESMREIAAEFGLDLEMDGVRLSWLVDRISRWQKARVERIAAERALVAACAEQRALLETANERLAPLGLERITETRALRGTVAKLREDLSEHERAAGAFRKASEDGERENREIERLTKEISRMLDRVGIAAGEEHVLVELCARADEYRQHLRAFEISDGQRAQIEEDLRGIEGFDESLLTAARDALAERVETAERQVAEMHSLGQEVGSLRERIAAATAGHELEDALAEEGLKREALLEIRSRELRAAIGALLVEHVERETRSEHLPEVFHRANELFNRITRGAYELRVDGRDTPSFLAYDTRQERGFPLEELSSGTRVQLLLAVRIAFVERLEAGVALPLLMDETLANSDDERAAAIMDAVIQLAADGRQIFYFTAQPDEIAKWMRALAERPDVEATTIDLGEIRQLERRLDFDALEVVESSSPVPTPAGRDHRDYGRSLGIPRVSIHAPVGALHLWYLVEDPELLHYVLAELQVSTWGELQSLMTTGGGVLLDAATHARIRAAAEMAEAALDRIRVGRGRSVDRRALVESGAVTDRFINEVDELRRGVEGDGKRLIEQLEARAVAKFQTRNIEAMREFFEREGFLDDREPLSMEIIRRQIIAEQSLAGSGEHLSLAEVDRLLARVGAGAGLPVQSRRQPPPPQPLLWPEPPA